MALSTEQGHSDHTAVPIIVGLTGGMGAGKSVVASILRCMGYPVYDADAAAKRMYVDDAVVGAAVRARFGDDVYTTGGMLDRKRLADCVFGDDEALADLNAIVHPAVQRNFDGWQKKWSQAAAPAPAAFPVLFREAAILFESGAHEGCDRVWSVTAPEKIRMKRVMERNGWSPQEFTSRTRHQWAPDRVNAASDAVIINDGFKPLVPAVVELVAEIQWTGNDSVPFSSLA